MIIQHKIGNSNLLSVDKEKIDWLELEWYETSKRVLRKKTKLGTDVSLKFLAENPALTEGDILYEDEQRIIVVTILPCDSIVVIPKNMLEMASVCYEIGNKHLPLFYEKDELLIPFERPLYNLLLTQGYEVRQEKRKLIQPLRTTVSPHEHAATSLFSKIMKLTATNE
jgi:urease accessory protein